MSRAPRPGVPGPEPLVAAADPLEPVATEREVVAAAEVPRRRRAAGSRAASALVREATANGPSALAGSGSTRPPIRRQLRVRGEQPLGRLDPAGVGDAVVIEHGDSGMRGVSEGRVLPPAEAAVPPSTQRTDSRPVAAAATASAVAPELWSATTTSAGSDASPRASDSRQRASACGPVARGDRDAVRSPSRVQPGHGATSPASQPDEDPAADPQHCRTSAPREHPGRPARRQRLAKLRSRRLRCRPPRACGGRGGAR